MAGPPRRHEGAPALRILILAGEASGDAHGSHVAREIRRRWPSVSLLGLGGPRMAQAGVELLRGLDDLAVMGFVEVLGRLAFFRRLEGELRTLITGGAVDLVLPIDYPGLNLRITERAHEAGVPVVYYISPQVWAWKAHRAARLAQWADRIAVILPFEVPIYEAVGGAVSFVGHPLLDETENIDTERFMDSMGLDPDRPVLALFPGSRRQELKRHLGPFLDVASAVGERRPDVQTVLGKA
ncbi:MAG: lipid-A-disaccharide synthase, partial [Gemmatimonadetes bacterium]|nr:lipid-A-disaccharide synthase [Gemmatimonadota bacterium]